MSFPPPANIDNGRVSGSLVTAWGGADLAVHARAARPAVRAPCQRIATRVMSPIGRRPHAAAKERRVPSAPRAPSTRGLRDSLIQK
eukprot:scaffold2705_cov109-Isochrysis_galbana.AAC.15